MFWDRRNHLFLVGAPLAVVPAIVFLPLLTYLVLNPSQARSGWLPMLAPWNIAFSKLLLQGLIFTGLIFFQMAGSVLVGFASSWGGLRYVTLLAIPTSLLLLAIEAYTGMFLALFAAHI